ncbi:SMI1 / KNR4 family protein (plasmid) [Ochrobactrum quorumnocens]|uniref:SMI1 / KNR4 family protein n=1 Tax=Ochrobactrum quorumnocens TaxID=271865 RepID=A0A248UN79_9HYPH|nr:SMI1/KNR4 family protein [[Ochrobactrum] quorumnocens]ASV88293.1 SMI1 / KNR4 family protein [[Ochrobactrum] quorumnocens]
MAEEISNIIEEVNSLDDPTKRSLPLPDDALIHRYEIATGIGFSPDYKEFLKNVSNAFVGYLSPLTLNEEMGGVYGELYTTIQHARSIGLPADWLPICEDNGDYYCITPDDSVRFWSHDGPSSEAWPNLSAWANEVWLQGN